MRYALVNDQRREASPGLAGCCPGCSEPTIAKCGAQRIWHWAHRGNRACDPWWEPETAWHRSWKNQFPSSWQEVIRRDDKGEKHIADVITGNGAIIELQHSHLPAPEKSARERFYQNLVWVVDGLRLKNDKRRFFANGNLIKLALATDLFITRSPESCLPSGWLNCTKPVLFDFEGFDVPEGIPEALQRKLWCLLPGRIGGCAVVAAVSREWFLDAARKRDQIIPTQAIAWFVQRDLDARRRNYAPRSPFRGRRRAKF